MSLTTGPGGPLLSIRTVPKMNRPNTPNPDFDLDEYFERIGYTGTKNATESLLEGIHRAQAYTIPFENFDIAMDRDISLEPQALVDKLVRKPRGGYCFELNGLFYLVLKALGFKVQRLLGRIHVTDTPTGRGHQLNLVTIQGRQWVADVGFGHPGLRAPIPFELEWETMHDGQTFRLVDGGPYGTMLQSLEDHEWRNLFSFDLEHVCDGDIEYGNYFNTRHPKSFFRTGRLAALPLQNGVVTLYDGMRSKSVNGQEDNKILKTTEDYLDCLTADFGIEFETTDDLALF